MSDRGLIYDVRRKIQVLAYDLTSPEFMSKIYFRVFLNEKLDLKNPKTLLNISFIIYLLQTHLHTN